MFRCVSFFCVTLAVPFCEGRWKIPDRNREVPIHRWGVSFGWGFFLFYLCDKKEQKTLKQKDYEN